MIYIIYFRLEEGVPANLTCILHTVDQTIESVLEPSFRIGKHL